MHFLGIRSVRTCTAADIDVDAVYEATCFTANRNRHSQLLSIDRRPFKEDVKGRASDEGAVLGIAVSTEPSYQTNACDFFVETPCTLKSDSEA